MNKVFLFGERSKRTPTAYQSYQNLLSDSFVFDCKLDDSDIVVLGHIKDIYDVDRATAAILQSKNLILLSEEPLWDVQSGGFFLDQYYEVKLHDYDIRVEIHNHANSDLFEYINYPYFLTTDNRYFFHYARMFLDSSNLSLRSIWDNAEYQYLYIGEKRPSNQVHLTFRETLKSGHQVYGLSHLRDSIPTNLPQDRCLLIGKGWIPAEQIERQSLFDWHLEKLFLNKGKSLFISALENTLCPNYVSEKLFDAYAMLGIPVYYNQSGLVKNSLLSHTMFDISNQELTATISHILDFKPDQIFIEKYIQTRHHLSRMFSNYADYLDERMRFSSKIRNILLKYC